MSETWDVAGFLLTCSDQEKVAWDALLEIGFHVERVRDGITAMRRAEDYGQQQVLVIGSLDAAGAEALTAQLERARRRLIGDDGP